MQLQLPLILLTIATSVSGWTVSGFTQENCPGSAAQEITKSDSTKGCYKFTGSPDIKAIKASYNQANLVVFGYPNDNCNSATYSVQIRPNQCFYAPGAHIASFKSFKVAAAP
ncbi:hypothetical protein ASPWEDRAFT_35899 [Aspergillus wentii DTO 134E9]|uniref:Uncharacterized protein n=1 Tax=Aspergillus wentii DTO 134E9 TaxID=1073089 RepID=A0A1L9RTL7_ASPWE|nr:uncharacterized protein ASPWEDRAFT_35899 [Aspergillus wentii DTO 134E9]KAI9933919.1 hypothetical protein MW887_004991 [Aspergillus wentii]OJJ38272.1 hypothetical protein ASPWEDRAFT_35899 [Aspergillus wentii DTO 134E9]